MGNGINSSFKNSFISVLTVITTYYDTTIKDKNNI